MAARTTPLAELYQAADGTTYDTISVAAQRYYAQENPANPPQAYQQARNAELVAEGTAVALPDGSVVLVSTLRAHLAAYGEQRASSMTPQELLGCYRLLMAQPSPIPAVGARPTHAALGPKDSIARPLLFGGALVAGYLALRYRRRFGL